MTVTDRIPRRILGSQPSTGRTTPVSTPSSILEPLTLALQVLDPLTEFSVREEMDPLSKMAAEMVKHRNIFIKYIQYWLILGWNRQ